MAFNNWNLPGLTGDGETKDTVGQGQPGYEVVIFSIWVTNNSGTATDIELFLTDSEDNEYFKITRALDGEEDAVINSDGSGGVFLICLNSQDKVKARSDQAALSVIVSKDETYAG